MSDQPPAFLMRAADWAQQRIDRVWPRNPSGEAFTDEAAAAEHEQAQREEAARFERRWGVVYIPIALLVILWLLTVSVWDRV